MRLHSFAILLPIAASFVEAAAPLDKSVCETRITTIVLPATHTESEATNVLVRQTQSSLLVMGTEHNENSLEKKATLPMSFPTIRPSSSKSTPRSWPLLVTNGRRLYKARAMF
jgi:hypothetical protein